MHHQRDGQEALNDNSFEQNALTGIKINPMKPRLWEYTRAILEAEIYTVYFPINLTRMAEYGLFGDYNPTTNPAIVDINGTKYPVGCFTGISISEHLLRQKAEEDPHLKKQGWEGLKG